MDLIADLHIHGSHSRGCSKDISIDTLEKYAKLKGVGLLGTGDFSQPDWFAHIKNKLTDDGNGFLYTKGGFPFVLQTEYSLIYSQGGKGRRVHVVMLAPDLDTAQQINTEMGKVGRLDYDGRPIFGMACPDFVEKMMSISRDIEIFPAHIWTPWFSLLGSKSGFDRVEECFGDQTKHIHAIETGLSSDPQMNWRLSQLDRFSILSTSDSHSYWPWRLGREATCFKIKPGYKALMNAIRSNEITETIEVDPNYGKYHIDGHRKCNVAMYPKESLKHKNICPVCKKPLTIGVLQRVEELADRPEDYKAKERPGYKTLIPLHEIIALVTSKGVATKSVWEVFGKLTQEMSEYEVLLTAPSEELGKIAGEEVADAIIRSRECKIVVRPGYDGVYGEPVLKGDSSLPKVPSLRNGIVQRGLGDFL